MAEDTDMPRDRVGEGMAAFFELHRGADVNELMDLAWAEVAAGNSELLKLVNRGPDGMAGYSAAYLVARADRRGEDDPHIPDDQLDAFIAQQMAIDAEMEAMEANGELEPYPTIE